MNGTLNCLCLLTEQPRPRGGRLQIHFQPPVCHNGFWLFDVFRFVRGGVGQPTTGPSHTTVAGFGFGVTSVRDIVSG